MTVTMDISEYERLKAFQDASENNYTLFISKGGYYNAYILKTDSEIIRRLSDEIMELQEKLKEKEERKKLKIF